MISKIHHHPKSKMILAKHFFHPIHHHHHHHHHHNPLIIKTQITEIPKTQFFFYRNDVRSRKGSSVRDRSQRLHRHVAGKNPFGQQLHFHKRCRFPRFRLISFADANLRVFEADVLDYDAVSRAVEGCKGVFHVASPCTLEDPLDPEKELVLPAVQGTVNLLEAAKRFGVRRVVITSSISAIVPNPGWKDKVFDETSWTDLDYCKSRKKWYPVSKTLAEKAAWEFAETHGMDVVAIHPATCLGPLMQPYLNASCAVLLQLLQGSKDTQEYHWLGAVHVKDVAKAQVLLFECPAASGRYLCTNGIYQFAEFSERVSKLFPDFPVHRFNGETQPGLISCEDAAKRLIDLGLCFTPVEDAVRETVESLEDKGFLGQQM